MNALTALLLSLLSCSAVAATATTPLPPPTLPDALAEAADGQWRMLQIDLLSGIGAPCCVDFNRPGATQSMACGLDDEGWNMDADRPVPPGTRLNVYLRRDRTGPAGLDRVRAFASSCALTDEAAAVPQLTLDEAAATSLLVSLARQSPKRVGNNAIAVLALQQGDQAGRALEGLSAAGEADRVRRDATFWLTQTRGAQGFAAVQRLLEDRQTSRKLRRHAVFALSQSDEAGRDAALIALGREDYDPEIRGEALFWLAQVSPGTAEPALVAAARGADFRIADKAIFGLSQLPAGRAVPALSALARDRGLSRKVRKQALFWLSQTDAEAAMPEMDRLLGVER